jgi:ubiquinone/menaquinone biosynthesis C-methylase UbiE
MTIEWDHDEVAGELRFRTDLYRGTAPFYDRYRPPYPEELMDDLRQRLPASGRGRLLDLACGTGQIAFPLADAFAEVWAVDQEEESVAYGRAKAEAGGITNITWVSGSAESVALDGSFELVAVGNAFHRLNRQLVAERMYTWLQPGGGAALLWGGSPWAGDRPWQQAMAELFEDWMAKAGATYRVPAGWEAAMEQDPHEQVLRRAGFQYVGRVEFSVGQTWTLETLTGFVYSTSFLNRETLGEKLSAFESDLAERLLSYEHGGNFEVLASYAYELARKPR